jgi:hypothetical protein
MFKLTRSIPHFTISRQGVPARQILQNGGGGKLTRRYVTWRPRRAVKHGNHPG